MAKDSVAICDRKATHYLKVPLKSTEQIYLVFLIPILISCIVYITHFASDLVVAVQHFREDNPVWGCCTIGLIYVPAITYFILTVSRPDWWMTDDNKLTGSVFSWFCFQALQLVAFPFFALYRYAGLIVLTVDAILLTGEERRKTLNIAAAPAAIELYFFLQAWFQAVPQALFQTHLLFKEIHAQRSRHSVNVQVLCIFTSIVVIAIETASFQRFESQRVNGRKLPWAMWLKKYCIEELKNIDENVPLQTSRAKEESATSVRAAVEDNKPVEEPTAQVEQQNEIEALFDRQISVTPPLPPKNVQIVPPPAPLRGITTVVPLAIPDAPAPPRPDSIVQAERTQNNDKNLRIPERRYSVKGLEEDDPIGKFVSFLWWFFFIAARILAIAVFYEFFPLHLLGVLGVHYVVMLMYLFYYTQYRDAITILINLWLGLVYILSVIEYRIKFKYADKWLLAYYIFVMLQNTFITLTWFFYADWDNFWYTYVFCAIFVSTILCILSSLVYYVLFKPKKCRIYSS